MSYITGYSAERAQLLLNNINNITGKQDTNITDAVRRLMHYMNKDVDTSSSIRNVPIYEIFTPVDAKIDLEVVS